MTDLFHKKLNIYKPNGCKCAIELVTKPFSNARNKILKRKEKKEIVIAGFGETFLVRDTRSTL